MFELRIGQAADKGMDWLQWSSSLVSSLAWPVAAVAIACIFRGQIAALLKKVRKLSWGDKAVDFSEQLDKIEKVAQTASEPEGAVEVAAPIPDPLIQQLVSASPSAAIVEAWKPIERKLRRIYRNRYRDREEYRAPSHIPSSSPNVFISAMPRVIDQIYSDKLIEHSTYIMLMELRALRNAAAHQQDVSAVDAFRFIDLAETVMRELDKITTT